MRSKIKDQKSKCKIKEVMAATRPFHNFDIYCLIFDFPIGGGR